MSKSTVLYIVFCTLVVAGYMLATDNGYSPFAAGGARAFGFVHTGPTHK